MKKQPEISPINKVINELVVKYAEGVNTAIAEKLGVTPQSIGQYRNGVRQPNTDFIAKWRKVYGDDLIQLAVGGNKNKETNVSRETNNETAANVNPDEYRAWIGDLRSDIYYLREVNNRYLQIIENLSAKVSTS